MQMWTLVMRLEADFSALLCFAHIKNTIQRIMNKIIEAYIITTLIPITDWVRLSASRIGFGWRSCGTCKSCGMCSTSQRGNAFSCIPVPSSWRLSSLVDPSSSSRILSSLGLRSFGSFAQALMISMRPLREGALSLRSFGWTFLWQSMQSWGDDDPIFSCFYFIYWDLIDKFEAHIFY